MGGISSSIPTQTKFFPLEILINENTYRISISDFDRTAPDTVLLNFTKNVLQTFKEIERTINKTKQLQLMPAERDHYLIKLAKWGRRAYQEFFNEDAQQATVQYSKLMPFAPIFVSKLIPFPWEVLYEGE
ncbi:MAG: hypothetical protein RIB93_26320 [Coleofasciculus sp. D1-CHI-01]|uniref:hypothetical protein n=1 Tax=Coleofasciculus sp. D1-CHI-01 TaxID=3068482 RepID=UPI003303F08F